MPRFFIAAPGILTSSYCSHVSAPHNLINITELLKIKTSACKITFAYSFSLISCISLPEMNLMSFLGTEERWAMVVMITLADGNEQVTGS